MTIFKQTIVSFELFQEVWRLEILGNVVVESCDHFIDGFLPRLFRVFARLDRFEELPQSLFAHITEVFRDLRIHTNVHFISH